MGCLASVPKIPESEVVELRKPQTLQWPPITLLEGGGGDSHWQASSLVQHHKAWYRFPPQLQVLVPGYPSFYRRKQLYQMKLHGNRIDRGIRLHPFFRALGTWFDPFFRILDQVTPLCYHSTITLSQLSNRACVVDAHVVGARILTTLSFCHHSTTD